MDLLGRCGDGSANSVVSPRLAEATSLKGSGKITAITLTVALHFETEAQQFSFSRSWTVPRTVLHLSNRELALVTIAFFVAEDDLACEDLLTGLPVLRHLRIDTRTLLEKNCSILDGADC